MALIAKCLAIQQLPHPVLADAMKCLHVVSPVNAPLQDVLY